MLSPEVGSPDNGLPGPLLAARALSAGRPAPASPAEAPAVIRHPSSRPPRVGLEVGPGSPSTRAGFVLGPPRV